MAEEQNKIVKKLTYVEPGPSPSDPGTTVTYHIGADADNITYNENVLSRYLDDLGSGGSGSSFNFNTPKSILTSDQNNTIKESVIKFGDTEISQNNPYKEDFAKLLNEVQTLRAEVNTLKNLDLPTKINSLTTNGKFTGASNNSSFLYRSWYGISADKDFKTLTFDLYNRTNWDTTITIKNLTQNKNLFSVNFSSLTGSHTHLTKTISTSVLKTTDVIQCTATNKQSGITISGSGVNPTSFSGGAIKGAEKAFWVVSSWAGNNSPKTKSLFDTSLLDLIYPKGSLYITVENTNPRVLFGGTWERIKGKFLVGTTNGDEYSFRNKGKYPYAGEIRINNTGGSAFPYYHRHSGGLGTVTKAKKASGSSTNVVTAVASGSTGYVGVQEVTGSFDWGNNGTNCPPYIGVHIWKRTG